MTALLACAEAAEVWSDTILEVMGVACLGFVMWLVFR